MKFPGLKTDSTGPARAGVSLYCKAVVLISIFAAPFSASLFARSSASPLELAHPSENASSINVLDTHARLSPPDSLVPYLRNGSFEQLTGPDTLLGWDQFRQGFIDNSSSLAHSGQYSVRSSWISGFSQTFLLPISPFQSFAIGGQAYREFDYEKAGIRSVFFEADGSYVTEETSLSPVDSPASQYGPFWAAQETPEKAALISLFPRSETSQQWIRFDDLQIYTEQLQTSPSQLGEPWQLSDGVANQSGPLTLFPGSTASQRVVMGLDKQSYFTWGRYIADSDTQLTVSETMLPRNASETTSTTSTTHSLTAPGGIFLADPGRPAGKATGQARVTLEVDMAGSVTLTSLRRGFAKAEPSVITAGPASPDGSLKLTAAWPDYLSTATIQILQSNTQVALIEPQLLGSSIRAEWDPTHAAAGDYTARFLLEAADGETAVVDRSFQVVTDDATTSTVPGVRATEFTRAAWLFLEADSNTTRILNSFQLVRQDGFNFVFVTGTQNQLPLFRQGAEAAGLPFVIFEPVVTNYAQSLPNHDWVGKVEFLAKLKEWFASVSDSPLFRGIYIFDDPQLPEAINTARKITLSLVQDGSLGLPWIALTERIPADAIATIQPPVGMLSMYPYALSWGKSATDALLERVNLQNEQIRRFDQLNHDYWTITQSYTNRIYEDFYPVTASAHYAQLGAAVMAGARGYLTFTYSSGSMTEGIRSFPNYGPTPQLVAYQRFNSIMNRIGPTVMGLGVPDILPGVPSPFAASTAVGPGGTRFQFILNGDSDATHTLLLEMANDTGNNFYDIIAERSLPRNANHQVIVKLGPGEWAMFASGNSTISQTEPEPENQPAVETLDLPVTHQFTMTRIGGQGQPVYSLDFSSDAATLAGTIGLYGYEPSAPQVFNLANNGQVIREPGPVAFPAEGYGIINEDLVTVHSQNIGVRLYNRNELDAAPVASFEGYSGGAFDILKDGDTVWLSLNSMGIRQLYNGPSGLQSVALASTLHGSYRDIFGPFEDGSVTMISTPSGVVNIKPGNPQAVQENYAFYNSVDRNGSMNSSRLLAVPCHQFGVALFQLSATGEPLFREAIATEAIDASAVAWIGEKILAVADGSRHVLFYSVTDDEVVKLGSWRPPLDGFFYMLGMDAAANRLAVSTYDGRVVVADTESLRGPTAVNVDWASLE